MRLSVLSAAALAVFLLLLVCATTPSHCKENVDVTVEDQDDEDDDDDDDDESDQNIQLSFPLIADHTAYAVIQDAIPYPLKELTLCHWVRFFNATDKSMIFQYSVKDQPRAIATYATLDEVYFDVGLGSGNEVRAPLSTKPRNGEWVHFCFTWSAYTGSAETYLNGKKIKTETDKGLGRPVAADGVAILGQDQSSPGVLAATAASRQTFKGDISQVQLWNHVLCADEVAALANCTSESEGNIIAWSEVDLVTFNGANEQPLDNLCSACSESNEL